MALKKDITNVEVRDALIAMGIIQPGANVDITGAQNGEFKNGLNIDFKITPEQFDAAKTLARWDGNPDDTGDIFKATSRAGLNLAGTGDAAGLYQKFHNVQTTGQPVVAPGAPQTGSDFREQRSGAPAPAPLGTPAHHEVPGEMAATAAKTAPATTPTTAPAGGAGTAPAGGGGGPDNKVTVDNPANWNDDKIKTWLKQNLGGTDAWFIDIPEVWNAMSNAVRAGKNATQVDGVFMDTAFYKQNSASARGWYAKQRSDPAQTAADVAQETQHITNQAQQVGITLDPDRAQQMAQSYLRFGWTDTDLQRAIGAEWHYDPSTKQQASAVTQMKAQARDWLVPLSDQAIQTWGQGLISGSVTQDQWTQYLRDSAKSLMPQLATLIDQHAGDPKFSVSTFADPYKQHAVNLLGIQADQVDLNDPSNKWRQALDTVDAKTGERRIMSLSEWDTKLKTDKQYGYDSTANGINDGLALAQSLKQSMGFA